MKKSLSGWHRFHVSDNSARRLTSLLEEIRLGLPHTEKLVAQLRLCPEFGVFDEKLQSTGDAAVVASLSNLANWMVGRAAIVGSGNVVSDLYRYVNTEQIPFQKIMVLSGVSVKVPLTLTCGIEVIPFDMLSASTWKEATLDYFGKSWANYRPTAAIQQPFLQHRKELHAQRPGNVKANEEFRDLEDVQLCMTAIGPCAPLGLGSWIQAEDWVPNLANMALLPERLNAGNYPRSVGEDWRELYSLHECWVVLNTKEKSYLRVALSRINSALRYSELVQASIDLGIAMDALFLSGTAAARGEAGLTLRLRAARFLGKDPQSRSEISDLFSALYLLRNIAVHAGVVGNRVKSPASKSKREYDTQDLLNDGFHWVGKAIRRIIREGEPDWQSIILE